MGYTYNKKLFVVYLKFQFKHPLFLFTKSGRFVHAVFSEWNGFCLSPLPFSLLMQKNCHLTFKTWLMLPPHIESFGFITFGTYHYYTPVTLDTSVW